MIEIIANQESKYLRLDRFLCHNFDISYPLAQKLIREKKVKINNEKVFPYYKIKDQDRIKIFSDLKKRTEFFKKKPKLSLQRIKNFIDSIIYQDENLMAINKPSGLATQGGSGVEISVDDFLAFLPNCESAQLVHRLDKDTSGILLIARNKNSAEFLTECFKDKIIKKTYLALVCGVVKKKSGTINIPLKKKFVDKNEKVYPDFTDGKEAITHYKLIKNFDDYSLLELNPITGRTHQLRVHCKEIGYPIINDVKYGGKKVARRDIAKRLCLHAQKIEIANYFGKKLEIKAELPEFYRG